MELDKAQKRYFEKKFFKGKGRVARILDAVLGRAFLCAALCIVFWFLRFGLAGAIIASISATLIWSVLSYAFHQYRYEAFLSRTLEAFRRQCILEKLILLEEDEYRQIAEQVFLRQFPDSTLEPKLGGFYDAQCRLFCCVFPNHPSIPVTSQQILNLYRKRKRLGAKQCAVLSASEFDAAAQEMCNRLDIEMLGQDTLFAAAEDARLSVSQEDIENAIDAEMQTTLTREKVKQTLLSANKSRAYLFCAALLVAWCFLFRFNILYPILASVCVFLAFLPHLRKLTAAHSKTNG